jgi:predicted TPR repeat methyltransferase
VDLSAPMLDVARTKSVYDELHCADVLGFLSTQTAAWDVLVASGVLIFFGDLLPVLRAAAQVTRPDGVMIFTTYRSDDSEVSVRANYHFAHSAAHIRARAEEAGWKVESLAEAVHEREHGLDQPGFVVTLRRAQ